MTLAMLMMTMLRLTSSGMQAKEWPTIMAKTEASSTLHQIAAIIVNITFDVGKVNKSCHEV